MNEEEVQYRIKTLEKHIKDVRIQYSRDASGNIKRLFATGEGACRSDEFGFLIIFSKNNRWSGCIISKRRCKMKGL